MSIALQVKVAELQREVEELKAKLVATTESVAYLQGRVLAFEQPSAIENGVANAREILSLKRG